jgi:hypothetical protein
MKITTQYVNGEELLVVDEDPGMRERYERETGQKFPRTRTYKSNLDGHLQSWWRMTERAAVLMAFLERQNTNSFLQ